MEYKAGDEISYRPFGGGLRHVLVEERLSDVKHGRPGLTGIVTRGREKGTPVWGYDYQIATLRIFTNPVSGKKADKLRSAP
jgi:hypothetical protein